jgi:hypothetical protein
MLIVIFQSVFIQSVVMPIVILNQVLKTERKPVSKGVFLASSKPSPWPLKLFRIYELRDQFYKTFFLRHWK